MVGWSTHFDSVGPISPAEKTLAQNLYIAQLAAAGSSPTAEDGVLFDFAINQSATLGAVVDPGATSGVLTRLSVQGAAPGYQAVQLRLAMESGQAGAPVVERRAWQASVSGPFDAAAKTLMHNMIDADMAASANPPPTPETLALFDAMFAVAQAFATLVDPGAAAASSTLNVSVTRSVGTFDSTFLELAVSLTKPSAGGFGMLLLFLPAGTPAAMVGNQNNYNPPELATSNLLRISSLTSVQLTGLAAAPAGRCLALVNVGNTVITLKKENTGSAAPNRFALASDIPLSPSANGTSTILWYDAASSRWRSLANA
jgi:hypothetical protein